MARALYFLVLLCAISLVAADDSWDNNRLSIYRPYPRPGPPHNPCFRCKKCVARDYQGRHGRTICKECEHGFVLEDGKCVKECICTADYTPVCGKDGKTYSNACMAGCKKMPMKCKGECPCPEPPSCVCPKIWKPVCGHDGREYGNACLARCKGMKPMCEGGCPCKPDKPPTCAVRCKHDPCMHAKCPFHPDAKCRMKECSCEAEFVMYGQVVDCEPMKPPVLPKPPVCPYGLSLVYCIRDPCHMAECPAHKHAKCRANYCGGCKAEWFVHGKLVDCDDCMDKDMKCMKDSDCCGDLKCCKDCMGMSPIAYYGPPRKGVCMKRCPDCGRW